MILKAFSSLTILQKWVLYASFALLMAVKIYLFNMLPFHVDEAFNFVNFASKGVIHSATVANTHILSNIISALWWQIGLSPEMSFRITSIIAALLVHILLYSAATHYFNFKTGVFVLLMSGVTFWGSIYSVEGGAYMLMTLWVVVATVSLFRMLEDPREGRLLFIVSCILGFYTSRLFVIPFISFIILWGYKKDWMRMLTACAIIGGVSVLLYLPIMINGGIEAVLLTDVPRHDLIIMSAALFEDYSVIVEVNSKSHYVIIALAISGAIFFRKADEKEQVLIALGISTIFSILIFGLVVLVYPPSRALIYANILMYAIIGALAGHLKVKLLVLLLCLKIAASLYVYNYGWQHFPMGLQDTKSYPELNDLYMQVETLRKNQNSE